ncbi:MAG: O-antigen ligase family protein, partial [Bdellovibrionales bacterium]|nr:O-antigen ligase family protein [Bdellovibrionales bacterium]
AIFGTLSRAIWGASFLASAIFLSLTLSQWSSIRPGSHERGHRVRSRIRSLLILLSILFVGGSVVVLTLGLGAGKEIVLNRLAYGLLYTHDDMRWQLYADSIPLLSWLGLGTEGWRDAFPAVMSPGLAGIRPDYLHSEALQFMIEYGYIGAFVLCLPLTYLLLTVIRTPASTRSTALMKAALLAIFAGWTLALCFDFQLRTPANLVLVGVVIGIALAYRDLAATSRSSEFSTQE